VPAQRVKVEFFDQVGTRHTITIDGNVTKEKIAKVLDYVELMGTLGSSVENSSASTVEKKFERIRDLLADFQGRVFRSGDIKQAYEQRHGEGISLSTVCTYLSRFVDKGIVLRSGSPAQWLYTTKQPGTFSWNNIIQK
jgi:hypothetical protein